MSDLNKTFKLVDELIDWAATSCAMTPRCPDIPKGCRALGANKRYPDLHLFCAAVQVARIKGEM